MASNPFAIFQTESATMYKITVDGAGDETRGAGFSIEIDPDISWKRTFTRENEEINGGHTVISPNSNIDKSHRKWEIDFDGNTYQVEDLDPKHDIGTNNISHYEVVLR